MKTIWAKQRGLSLIELMVALAIGTLVSAAAIQIALLSQRGIVTQQGAVSLQNASLFGLNMMIRDIRLANLNSNEAYIDDVTLSGGIVFTPNNLSENKNPTTGALNFSISDNLVTKGAIHPSNLNGQQSDQLVVQYRVYVPNQFDCEGTELPVNTYVVQRYFLRADSNTSNDPNQALALACKAARYTADQRKTNTTLADLSGNGQIIIPRVDHFSVLLGVAQDGRNAACSANDAARKDGQLDCFGYMTLNEYRNLTITPKPQIVSVQLGLLVRSTESTGRNQFFNAAKQYQVLRTSATLKTHTQNNLYMRDVFTQTVALRNGFGIEK